MPGSGLGLAIVKKVVLNHGGLLRVEDTVPGGQPPGTSFYVLLPGRHLPAPTHGTPAAAAPQTEQVDAAAGPAQAEAGDDVNSRESANVISVDSQSARAR